MSYYDIVNGALFRAPDELPSRRQGIPPGVYDLHEHPTGKLFLVPNGPLRKLPSKIYGTVVKEAKRIVHTYLDRNQINLNTGVMMAGLKGSGKSLTAAVVANELITEHGGVCIRVNHRVQGTQLAEIIGNPTQPIMLDFDEYEKVYRGNKEEDKAYQESLLSFLSGGMTTKILSVLSVNSVSNVDVHFIDRPGRIFYHFTYKGLPRDVIQAYALDNVWDKSLVADLTKKLSRSPDISFDILSSVIQEINRYKCPVDEALTLMGYRRLTTREYRRVILYKGRDVSDYYDMETPVRIAECSPDRILRFDKDSLNKDSSRFNGALAEMSYEEYVDLPPVFAGCCGTDGLHEFGESDLYLAKTDNDAIALVWYSREDYSQALVVEALSRFGVSAAAKPAGNPEKVNFPPLLKTLQDKPTEFFDARKLVPIESSVTDTPEPATPTPPAQDPAQ